VVVAETVLVLVVARLVLVEPEVVGAAGNLAEEEILVAVGNFVVAGNFAAVGSFAAAGNFVAAGNSVVVVAVENFAELEVAGSFVVVAAAVERRSL